MRGGSATCSSASTIATSVTDCSGWVGQAALERVPREMNWYYRTKLALVEQGEQISTGDMYISAPLALANREVAHQLGCEHYQ